MNWTASLLRNQLKKEREAYQSRLNLLTNTNSQSENYLALEEKVKVLEANLETSEQNLIKVKIEAENKEKVKETEVKDKDQAITHLEKKVVASKELIFNLHKEIRTNSLYYQQELRKVREDYQAKLKTQTKQLRAEITLLNSSETDQARELKERGKLVIKLEEQQRETKKELEFANSKVKQLNPLFNQVLSVIKKNVILRGKKDLKEAIANIQELMEWEKSPLVTETNTPTEETEEKETPKITEPSASDKKKLKKWRNISLDFTDELINQWESKGFSFEQTFDWVSNVGLKPSEAEYTYWLQNIIEIDSTKYLNETSPEDQAGLKEQFEEYKESKKK